MARHRVPGLSVAAALLCGALALGGCARLGLSGAGSGNARTAEMFENRVWLARDPDAAPGAYLAFLSEGTLIIDSCVESYRLAPWRWADDAAVVWEEDTRTLRAEVALVGSREMALLIDPEGANIARSYELAQSPRICGG